MNTEAPGLAGEQATKMQDKPQGYLSLRILIVDDDEEDFFILSEYFRSIKDNFYELTWCPEYNPAVEKVCSGNFDVVLVDFFLGAKTGLDLLREALANGCDSPFILLTGKGNHELDMLAMQAGAVDYLSKSNLDSENLERCIRYAYERTKFIRALSANEKKYRNIFERSTDAVFTVDEKLNFTDVNIATSILTEYEEAELKGLCINDLLSNPQLQDAINSRVALKNDVQDMEIVIKTKNGHQKNGILSLIPEKTASGRYYQGIIHDITQLKKAEKANLRLEKLSVTNRLIRMMGHEIRNPLNNINLSLEQILQEVKDPDLKVFFDIITRNSKRIEDLVTELLQASKPVEVNPVPSVLQAVVDDSFKAASDRMILKNIEYKGNFPAEDISIIADVEKLKVAFLNIIINAIEAMEGKEGGSITATIEKAEETCQLIIEDNGCGINEENLAKLFVPYFTAKRNGMGLGLATTLNILQSHHAEVEVESSPGAGTKFLLTFPLIVQNTATPS